jgi:iron complex transport system substrate-binding protein
MTKWTRREIVAAASLLPLAGGAAQAAAPRRVVSINSCTDGMLLDLGDRSQITALSRYAREAENLTIFERAKPFRITRESAEEIIDLRPDLVLSSRHNALATREALRKLNIRIETFGAPATIEESRQQLLKAGKALGHPERGAAMVARVDAAFAAAAPRPGQRRPTALVFQSNGFTAGADTLVGQLLTRVGFENAAGRYGLKQWGNLRLERLLADPPDLLISGQRMDGAPVWADRIGKHPALKSIAGRMRHDTVPEGLLYCGGAVFIPALARLTAVRDRYLRETA